MNPILDFPTRKAGRNPKALAPVEAAFDSALDTVCYARERRRDSLETALDLARQTVGALEAFLYPANKAA